MGPPGRAEETCALELVTRPGGPCKSPRRLRVSAVDKKKAMNRRDAETEGDRKIDDRKMDGTDNAFSSS